MDDYKDYIEFAKEIAIYAGKTMKKYFNQDNGQKYKGDKTVVTLADTEINSYLVKRVKEEYPNHAVDGEEEQFGDSNYLWVCDPVDGTAMYARHIPVAVFPGTKHKNCDIAAVKVIVEEAGGRVTDLFGNEQRYDKSINGAIISNEKVHDEVLETIKKYVVQK